jgi:hypothetical protein
MLPLSDCVVLYLYYCDVRILSYYVVPFLSYCVERGLVVPGSLFADYFCIGDYTPGIVQWQAGNTQVGATYRIPTWPRTLSINFLES